MSDTPHADATGDDRDVEQPLQFSDRRAALAFLLGIVALALVGVGGGALFRDSCEELFTVGGRQTFVVQNPAEVAGPAFEQALFSHGGDIGLGGWRGAVRIDPTTVVVGTEDGFLLFGPSGVDALEPGLSAVNANRGYDGLRGFPAFNGAAVGASGDAPYEVAIYDENLALIGCGEVVTDEPLLAIDRVRALHADGTTLHATGLDGDPDWSRSFDAEVGDVELLLGAALVTTAQSVHLIELTGGEDVAPPWAVPGPDGGAARILDVDVDRALLDAAPGLVVLGLRDGSARTVAADGALGAALLVGDVVAGAELPELPGGLELIDVETSGATYTALRVRAQDGVEWVLLYGPAVNELTEE